ncbi:MAG: magnesium transporter CorA family protein [Elusimicrobia bacterium]|nr:magnesium transporter CorA family protein [Elusimicrobiota bacterium]
MLKTFQISGNKLCEAEEGGTAVWLFIGPSDEEKKRLIGEFKLDEHTLNSALDPDEPARLEFEPEHLAVIFKYPKNYSAQDQFLFKVSSLGLFLFKDKLIIIMKDDIPLFEGKLFNHIESFRQVFLKVIYKSISHFMGHLRVIVMITDEIERKISISTENRYLLNLFSLEKSLVYYLNAINANEVVFGKIKNNAGRIELSPHDIEFLDDILIENAQCYKQAEIYSNILASLMDARASIVSNNLNILMKTLNVITISIMVPTFVVSAFSMNVGIPMARHPNAFWIILLLAAISVGGVTIWWFFILRSLHKNNKF